MRKDELISELESIRYLANNGKMKEVSHNLLVLIRRMLSEGVQETRVI